MSAESQRVQHLEDLVKHAGLLSDADSSQPVAYDGTGYLYAYSNGGSLKCINVREPLLDMHQQESPNLELQEEPPKPRVLHVHPPLPGPAQHLRINSCGTFAVAWCQSDEAVEPAMHVIPLTNGGDEVEARLLDDPSLMLRAGLQILQVSWHPASDAHFAVLASDNVLRLYHVDDLSAPEQQIEMQLESQPLGLPDLERTHMVAFAFGSASLWERFAVYLLASDSSLYVLTPLFPFGARISRETLQALHSSCDAMADEDGQRSCTRTWLHRTFPPQPSPTKGAVSALGGEGSDFPSCGAALDDHAPALCGPMHILSAGNATVGRVTDIPAAEADDRGCAVALTALRGAVGAVGAATSTGFIALLIIADTVQPRWRFSPPQCRTDDDSIVGVRLQCPRSDEQPLQLLLTDCIQLPATEEAEVELVTCPQQEDILFAAQPSAVYQITMPWLPRLAAMIQDVSKGREAKAALESLPPSRLRLASQLPPVSQPHLPSVAMVGDALLGTALVVSLPQGKCHVLAPQLAPPEPTRQSQQQPVANTSISDEDGKVVQERFSALMTGPAFFQLETPASEAAKFAGTAEGQKRLHDTVALLRERHIEFAHHAGHDLVQHCKRLATASQSQAERISGLTKQSKEASRKQQLLEDQISRSVKLYDNMNQRLRLLAELHHSLPRPLSPMEAELRRELLPALERTEAALATRAQDMVVRWERLKSSAFASNHDNTEQSTAKATMPPDQAYRVRETLAEQYRLLAFNLIKVQAVEQALS